jgi:Domain of unknown function (DUF4279)
MFLQDVDFSEEKNTKSAFVDFRMRLGDLSPTEVTKRLRIQPSIAWAKNEQYLGKTREPVTGNIAPIWRARPWGMWIINTKEAVHVKKVESHVIYLLNLLEPAQEQVKHYLERCEANSISFYIHWQPIDEWGSYELPSALLGRMAQLSHYVEFQFDCNASSMDENGS